MLRLTLCLAMAASAAAFAPSAMLPARSGSARAISTRGPTMQMLPLFQEGVLQGSTVEAIPGAKRPANLEGWVGDIGFDPLGFSDLIDMRWLREAELKHGRVCMLAATGMIVQDVYTFPGAAKTFGYAKMTALHDAAVKQGAMQQLLVWLGFLEIFGFVAIVQMLQGSDRQPGDFGFDPLGCGKNEEALARRQLVEVKNGRLAMISMAGMTHHYLLTGKGPIEFVQTYGQ